MYRLLIADDEDTERIGIKFLLNKFNFNFEITEASNGNEALEIIKQGGTDILYRCKNAVLGRIRISCKSKENKSRATDHFFQWL